MKAALLFFGTLAALLFLGDGKTSVVEVVAAAGVLAISTRVILTKKPVFLPAAAVFSWLLLLFYLLFRLPFSDSVAYSLYAAVRYLMAFIVFVLFANNLVPLQSFNRGVTVLALFALVVSLVLYFVPSWGTWLPEMSLLSNAYAHHHIVYLLLFALPFVLRRALEKRTWTSGAVAIIFFVVLIVSRARGAWFMVGLYFLFMAWPGVSRKLRVAGFVLAGLFLVMFTVTTIAPQVVKKTSFSSARLEYWQQATHAFKDNPLFGTGLGTFYLSSLRYQSQPNSYSWLAHSLPIQMASEIGALGVIGVIGVMWAIGKQVKRKQETIPLFEAVVLTGIFSVFDITLDYLVVWLLAWAAVGLLVAQNHGSARVSRWALYGALSLLGVFYIGSVGAEMTQLITHKKVFVQPFNTQRTLVYLDKKPTLSQKQISAILWFHRKNPEVLAAAGLFEKAVAQDPQNNVYIEKYATKLLEKGQIEDLKKLVYSIVASISMRPNEDTQKIEKIWKNVLACINTESLLWPDQKLVDNYKAKSLYFVALCLIKNKNFDEARELLRIAVDARASWSNIYLDYAALSRWRYHDEQEANRAVGLCEEDVYARKHCLEIGNNPSQTSVTDKDVGFVQ